MSQKKLFLLDAFALIYRAYFAFSNNHRINSRGLNTSAMFGFTNTLLEVLKKEKPTHMAVVFDTAAPTHRHDAFEDYKANRQEVPEDITASIPYVKRLITGFDIPVVELDGYEADDIIGTFSCKAEKAGFQTFMMTPDKDYGQLVTANVHIYKPARLGIGAEIIGVPEICAKYNISHPKQVIDILGLMGDSVDNIPGVPGIGEKTAITLVQQFGSVENLIANSESLKGKLKEKVENNKEIALLSKQLATIHCDVPLEFDEEDMRIGEPDKDALRELFTELEFRRLAQNVLGEELQIQNRQSIPITNGNGQMDMFGTASEDVLVEPLVEEAANVSYKTIADVPHRYHAVTEIAAMKELVTTLLQHPEVSFDTETTGIDSNNTELVGISFSVNAGEGWYIPIPSERQQALEILEVFKPFYEHPSILKIGQNVKYDINVLNWYYVKVCEPLFDTMLAHYLIQPEMRHNMNVLAETYLKYSPVSIETLIGKKGKGQGSMRDVPLEQITEYAVEDADVTLQLKRTFAPKLKDSPAGKLFEEVEVPLIPVLSAMEREGIKLDTVVLAEFSKTLEEDIKRLEEEIQSLAGTRFNVASPRQVGDILFDVLKIAEKPKKTKTGQYATSEDVLAKLSGKHLIVDKILDHREICKLKGTYVDALPLMVNPRTARLHTTFNQVVAVTGRLSSDNPNLQNIPIRTTRGREVRKAFVPRDENHTLLSADYSQIELRLMAELSKDPGLVSAFNSGQDIHAATAAKVYGIPLEEVSGEMRRKAKMVNFGIIYGISAFGLSERLNIPRREAADIIQEYFRQYPGIKDYMDEAVARARKQGYVETMLGRRRYLRDINSANMTVRGFAERNAINAPIQGSAADMIKVAMIRLFHEIRERKLRSRMLLQVHDELVFDVPHDEVEIIRPLIIEKMQNAIPMSVPVLVESGTGNNWLEAH